MPFLLWFAVTIGLSAALIFVVQPLLAKGLLPILGGSPMVWNTSMVFFQVMLLLGYLYAHWLQTMPTRRQVCLHGTLLTVAVALSWILGLAPPVDATPTQPISWLLFALLTGIGFPFLLLSATSPLLQAWFAGSRHRRAHDPYFLYAASNAGSLAGLLAFPFLLEPLFSLEMQRFLWKAGFIGFGLLMISISLETFRRGSSPAIPIKPENREPAPVSIRLRPATVILLALAPSSLLLAVTTFMTSDLAAVPLLWVLPLALYLLTFVIAFSERGTALVALARRYSPLAAVVLTLFFATGALDPLPLTLTATLAAFFTLVLACHGRLAGLRPATTQLTGYYLCLSLGGALGGTLNGIIAPLVFNDFWELPLSLLMVAAGVLLSQAQLRHRPWPKVATDVALAAGVGASAMLITYGGDMLRLPESPGLRAAIFGIPLIIAWLLHLRPVAFLGALACLLLLGRTGAELQGDEMFRARTFFGLHRVVDGEDGLRRLFHGTTVHGVENLRTEGRAIPSAYYHPSGPLGSGLHLLPHRQRVALIGLLVSGIFRKFP